MATFLKSIIYIYYGIGNSMYKMKGVICMANYRERLMESADVIEGETYVDMDYIEEVLDEIEEKVESAEEIANIEEPFIEAVKGIDAILQCVVKADKAHENKMPIDFDKYTLELVKNIHATLESMKKIKDVMESGAIDVITDLSYDLG